MWGPGHPRQEEVSRWGQVVRMADVLYSTSRGLPARGPLRAVRIQAHRLRAAGLEPHRTQRQEGTHQQDLL